MGEVYNNGSGGYTCDNCHKLLWIGRNGSKEKGNRQYIYSTQPDDVVTHDNKYYCSKNCAMTDKGNLSDSSSVG